MVECLLEAGGREEWHMTVMCIEFFLGGDENFLGLSNSDRCTVK